MDRKPHDDLLHPPTKPSADGTAVLHRFYGDVVIYAPTREDADRRLEQARIHIEDGALHDPRDYDLAVVADLLAEIPRRLIEHADLVVLNATQEVIKDRNGDEREVNRGEFTDLLTRARKVVWL